MADATALDVPADLAQVAEEKGIPLDLVRSGLALGFPANAIKGHLDMPGVTAEAAEQLISEQERIRAGGEITIPPELLDVAQKHEWPESLVKRALALGAAAERAAGGGPRRWPGTDTGPVVDEVVNGMGNPRSARESRSLRRYAQRRHLRGHTGPLVIPDGDAPRRLSDTRRRTDGLHDLRKGGTMGRQRGRP